MKKTLKTLLKNKFFFIFLILILIMFPATLYKQSDKDSTMIITTLGIDKKEDKLSISALAVIPNSSQEISAKLEVFEGDGTSIDEALQKISQNTGKNIGLAHCDCLLISKDLIEENITRYLDYFIRSANLTTYATVVVAEGKAKDLLEATKSSNDYLDLSLKNIVTFEEKRSLLENTNIEEFYRKYFTVGSTYYLPILSSESGEESAQGDSSTQSGSGKQENSQNKKIINKNKMALFKQGKFIRELTEDENFIYNLISPTSNAGMIKVENINDNYVTNSTEIFTQQKKFILPIYKFIGNTPTVDFNIFWSLEINEIIGENHSYASIDSLQSFQSDTVKEKIKEQVQEKLKTVTSMMKEDNVDILDLYTKFNAFKPHKWKEYILSLEAPNSYLQGINININLHLLNIK